MVVKVSLTSGRQDVFKAIGMEDVPVIGLAKEFEHVFIPQTPSPLILPKNSEALLLLQRIRDEHTDLLYHIIRNWRSKEIEKSVLDNIPGVGNKRKINLLKHFGDVSNIQSASTEDIAKVDGINSKLQKISMITSKEIIITTYNR